MNTIKLPLCYQCGVPHVPEEIAARVRSGEAITVDIIPHKGLAANVLKWGTGGLNIDKSRVGYASDGDKKQALAGDAFKRKDTTDKKAWARPWMEDKEHVERLNRESKARAQSGRFPSNVVFSHSLFCTDDACDEGCPVLALGEQSGIRKTGTGMIRNKNGVLKMSGSNNRPSHDTFTYESSTTYDDTGTASRFFHCFTPDVPFLYCAKSSRSERSKGCEGIEPAQMMRISSGPDKTLRRCTEHDASLPSGSNYYSCGCAKQYGDNPVEGGEEGRIHAVQNTHPTVKPQNLLRYLISMITPDNGIVLDMFFGSGSTGVAAIAEGYHFIGIEQSDTPQEPYCTIARARIAHALQEAQG